VARGLRKQVVEPLRFFAQPPGFSIRAFFHGKCV